MRYIWLLVLVVFTGCNGQSPPQSPGGFPDTLVVVTRNAPTSWYEGRDGVAGAGV